MCANLIQDCLEMGLTTAEISQTLVEISKAHGSVGVSNTKNSSIEKVLFHSGVGPGRKHMTDKALLAIMWFVTGYYDESGSECREFMDRSFTEAAEGIVAAQTNMVL